MTAYPDSQQEPTEADPAAGERSLVAAVLQQAVRDLRSKNALVRREAENFLRDAEVVRGWVELTGANPAVVLRALASGRTPQYHHLH
jgi:hypothetical protein